MLELPGLVTERGAIFSPCRRYRYQLWRRWDTTGQRATLNVIGLNPSIADESMDDATIRRCIGFARGWGMGGLVMTNLFALRSTDPSGLRSAPDGDPIGPENDEQILAAARGSGCVAVMLAWGVHGVHLGRAQAVLCLLRAAGIDGVRLQCWGVTKGGHPKHPLYLPSTTEPRTFAAATEPAS